ncbi:hypothetical protein [Sinomonas sp. P47F7]|uniref:hypothetical protein n=1 Tax=Sinomonas sp. P47F7 TaxID=3410987 RepID=UPI003BF4B54D
MKAWQFTGTNNPLELNEASSTPLQIGRCSRSARDAIAALRNARWVRRVEAEEREYGIEGLSADYT